MVHEDVDSFVDFGQALSLDGVTEKNLVAVVVARRIEFERTFADELGLQFGLEFRILRFQIDADAGQYLRQRLDVRLGIARADAHGVQLHDLARVVLVDVAGRIVGIVEITQHRRMVQRRREEIAELAEGMGADGVILVVADENADVGLVLMHVEMIEPEPGHAFTQLFRRIERAQDGPRRRLLGTVVHRALIDLLCSFLLVGIDDLVGALGLRFEGNCDVERKLVHVRHDVDLRLHCVGQREVAGRVQLLGKPALETDTAEVFGARRRYAPGEAIQQREIVRIEVAGPGAVPETSSNRYEQEGTQGIATGAGLPEACEAHRRVSPAIFAPG